MFRGEDAGVDVPAPVVLVVDDDPLVRRAVSSMLNRAGLSTIGVANGEAALAVLDADDCGVRAVVIDLYLERERGDALAAEIRTAHPALRCVVTSGTVEAARVDAISAMEGVEFLAKPYAPTALIGVLRESL